MQYFAYTYALDVPSIDVFIYNVVGFIHLVIMYQGSWAGISALCVEVEYCYTIAMSAWYSTPQLPGYKCAVKPLCTPFGCIYGYIWPNIAIHTYFRPYIDHIYTFYYNLWKLRVVYHSFLLQHWVA